MHRPHRRQCFVTIVRSVTIMRLTDRQTDRILIARPRLHFMQHGNKNGNYCSLLQTESSRQMPQSCQTAPAGTVRNIEH